MTSSEHTAVNDIGQGIGIGPLAWSHLRDSLDRLLEDVRKALSPSSESPAPTGGLGGLFRRSPIADTRRQAVHQTDLVKSLEKLEAFDDLLHKTMKDGKLLAHHTVDAVSHLKIMQAALEQARDEGMSKTEANAHISQLLDRVSEVVEELEPHRSAVQSLADTESLRGRGANDTGSVHSIRDTVASASVRVEEQEEAEAATINAFSNGFRTPSPVESIFMSDLQPEETAQEE